MSDKGISVKWFVSNKFIPRIGTPTEGSVSFIPDRQYGLKLIRSGYCKEVKLKVACPDSPRDEKEE